jgi:signal peptidase I
MADAWAKPPAKATKASAAKDDDKPAVKAPNAQFYAQTASMGPAIHSGETVGLDTTAYAAADPIAGDIVVYTYAWSSTVQFAHRIIGVGGDTVQLKDGAVILNGKALATKDEGIVKAGAKSLTQLRETLPNGRSYLVLHENPGAPENNTAVFTVPAGHYFVLADNRHNGSDSRRKDAGFLPRASIQGRLTMILRSNIDGREGAAIE